MTTFLRMTAALAVALAASLLVSPDAVAHENGKAQPRIAASVDPEPRLTGRVTVVVTDRDSGEVVADARVTVQAEMTRPHVMRTERVVLPEEAPGIYRGAIQFIMHGGWTLTIAVGGPDVVPATAKLETRVSLAESEADPTPPVPEPGDGATAQVLPTRIEDDITAQDGARMLSLWLHSLAGFGWIVGVLVMTIALSTRPGVLAETARERLGRAYRSWGAWLHWALVLVIVGTGVYQMLYVTPFPLAYTPGDLERLAEIPYGLLYEAILIAKLALFGVLLVTATVTLLRLVDPPLPVVPVTNPHPGFFRILGSALGPAGIVYLLTVPLIVAAAMALRYVHVLAHVAEVAARPGSG